MANPGKYLGSSQFGHSSSILATSAVSTVASGGSHFRALDLGTCAHLICCSFTDGKLSDMCIKGIERHPVRHSAWLVVANRRRMYIEIPEWVLLATTATHDELVSLESHTALVEASCYR